MGSAQLAMEFFTARPPAPASPEMRADATHAHQGWPCDNCNPRRLVEHQALTRTLDDAWLAKMLEPVELNLAGCDLEQVAWERFHLEYRRWLAAEEVERRRLGGRRERETETLADRRASRVLCANACGRLVHPGGHQLCRPCAQAATHNKARRKENPS